MKKIKIDEIEYVSVIDLAEHLGITYKTIYDKLCENKISSILVGKNKFYKLDECEGIISFYTLRNELRSKKIIK